MDNTALVVAHGVLTQELCAEQRRAGTFRGRVADGACAEMFAPVLESVDARIHELAHALASVDMELDGKAGDVGYYEARLAHWKAFSSAGH